MCFDGEGVEERFEPHNPNRHQKYLSYRLHCPSPKCTRKLTWAEDTMIALIDHYVGMRHALETVQLPPASEVNSKSLQLLRNLPPERLSGWPARHLRLMTDPEGLTPGVMMYDVVRYVIPFQDLCYRNSKLNRAR